MTETDGRGFYDVLGVKKQASFDEIRQAFKKVIIHKHPDRGGNEAEFREIQEAYEVLSDARRRRIYDHYGARGLQQSPEALFVEDFRGGAFAARPEDIEKQMSELRKENESLQKALMLVRPETASKYASSFEAWLRNRDPGEVKVVTSADISSMFGVAEDSYEPVTLPALDTIAAEYTKDGTLAEAVSIAKEKVPQQLRWGQVLVHMLAAPVTKLDHHVAKWSFVPGTEPQPVTMPARAGSEGVGMVVALGPGVEGLAVHDLVLPKRPLLGTWRRLGVFESSTLMRLPATTASPDSLANFMACVAGYVMLRDFGSLKPGDTILQTSAETAVGQTVIALAKLLQIKTINLVNDRPDFEEVADALQARGATHVWKNDGSILERMKRSRLALPRLGLDDQGGATLTRVAECLRPESTLVLHGALTNKVESFPFAALLYRNLEIRGFSAFQHLAAREADFVNLPHLLLPLLEQGTLDLDVSGWERLDDALPAALADTKPNVLLKFGTLDEAVAVAKELATTSAAPVERTSAAPPEREVPPNAN